MGNNLHTKELFEKHYAERTWDFYRSIVGEGVSFGSPGTWVDLGAGVGLLTECAHRFGIKCVALEGSLEGIKIARTRFPAIDIRHHLLENDLPFEDRSIATIICNQVIEHLPLETANHMLEECLRVLQPQGSLFIYSPSIFDQQQRLEETHINLYSPVRLKKEVEAIGFKIMALNNSPRMILGKNHLARVFINILYKILPMDFLSGSANCIAVKP